MGREQRLILLGSNSLKETEMAKKKGGQTSPPAPEGGDNEAGTSDSPYLSVDGAPEVAAAEAAVRRAEAELKKANELYRNVRRQATEQLKQVREKTLGDLIDDTLKLVRKHPGPSVAIATLIGFCLGRLFRR